MYQANFYYDPKCQRFDTTSYFPEQMDSNFSVEEAREFLADAESHLTQHYKRFPQWLDKFLDGDYLTLSFYLFNVLVFLLGFILVIFHRNTEGEARIIVEDITTIFLKISAFIFILFILIALLSVFWNRNKVKSQCKVRKNIQAHIEQTHSHYQRKCVAWIISKDLFKKSPLWGPKLRDGIELWKYDPMQDLSDRQNEPRQQNSQNFARLIEEFPYDQKDFKSCYSPFKTRNQVSFEEVRQFLDRVAPSFIRTNKSHSPIIVTGILGFLGYILLLSLLTGLESPTISLLIFSLSVHFVYVIIFISVMVYYVNKMNKIHRTAITNIQAIIEQTASQMNAKGFRWVLSKDCTKSVQLWEDKTPQMEPLHHLQDGELPVQINVEMYDAFEKEDNEIFQGHAPIGTQDNLLLLELMRKDAPINTQDNLLLLELMGNKDRNIVFDYNSGSGKFTSHHYFPGLTQNKVPTDEIKKILTEIESRLALYRRTCFGRLFRVTVILAGLVIFVAFNIGIADRFLNGHPLFSIIGFPTAIGTFIVLIIAYAPLSSIDLSRMKKNILPIIQQRAAEYDEKGLEWFIPQDSYESFLYIELREKNTR